MDYDEIEGKAMKAACAVEGVLLLQEWFEGFKL